MTSRQDLAKLLHVFIDLPFEAKLPGAQWNEDHLFLQRYRLVKPLAERGDNMRIYWAKDTQTQQDRLVIKLAWTFEAAIQPAEEYLLLTQSLKDCPYTPQSVRSGFDETAKCLVFVQTPLGRDLDIMFHCLKIGVDKEADVYRECFLQVMGPKAVVALIEIHKRGVIHRDIKPSNIIYHRAMDRIMFIDFGAATADAKSMQGFKSSDYASERVNAEQPGTFEDDWISLAYTWYSCWVGDVYMEQVKAGTRPSLQQIGVLFPFLADKLPK
jgi:serine/threonine protein kinase